MFAGFFQVAVTRPKDRRHLFFPHRFYVSGQ
jgi:hypothetical protein